MRNSIIVLPIILTVSAMIICCAKPAPKTTGTSQSSKPDNQVAEQNTESTPPLEGEHSEQESTSFKDGVKVESTPWPITETGTFPDRLPQGWPQYIPIMDGLTVHQSICQSPDKREASIFGSGAGITLEKMQEFYTSLSEWKKFNEHKWLTTGNERYLLFNRGDEHLMVTFSLDAGGTLQFQINYTIPQAQ